MEDRTKKVIVLLESAYGEDIHRFLYRREFTTFIREEILPFLAKNSHEYPTFLNNDYWSEKHPFNFPGPFYTGETDTYATGIEMAPSNVINDAVGLEAICRQPVNMTEFVQVLNAAAVEFLNSYSCNGNDYWTYEKCIEWWHTKDTIIEQLRTKAVRSVNNVPAIKSYSTYLQTTAEMDLRKYCYFLEHGYYPKEDVALPELI